MSYAPSISAQAGRLFALYTSAAVSPLVYNKVTGLRATDLAINGNPVDITTKTSGGFRELLPGAGITSFDFSGSGVWDSNNTYLNALQAAVLNSPTAPVWIAAKIMSGAGDSFAGYFAVATFKRSGSHNDAEMFDMTLNSSGTITYTPHS